LAPPGSVAADQKSLSQVGLTREKRWRKPSRGISMVWVAAGVGSGARGWLTVAAAIEGVAVRAVWKVAMLGTDEGGAAIDSGVTCCDADEVAAASSTFGPLRSQDEGIDGREPESSKRSSGGGATPAAGRATRGLARTVRMDEVVEATNRERRTTAVE
jgi:hypothetical protein